MGFVFSRFDFTKPPYEIVSIDITIHYISKTYYSTPLFVGVELQHREGVRGLQDAKHLCMCTVQ